MIPRSLNDTSYQSPSKRIRMEENVVKKVFIHGIAFQLEELLESEAMGRALLNIYKCNEEFTSTCQSYLVDIIVLFFLNKQVSLKNKDFDDIADEIVRMFPREKKAVYYVPPIKKKNSTVEKAGVSKGKLPDKWRNRSAFIRNANNLMKKFGSGSHDKTDTDELLPDVRAENSKNWLIHNHDPVNLVLKHWDWSFDLRRSDCLNKEYKCIEDITKKWPILNTSQGYALIEKDFAKKFPETDEQLVQTFGFFFNKVYSLFRQKLNDKDKALVTQLQSETLSQNSADTLRLWLLQSLVAPRSNKISLKEGPKKFWKPSIDECREGLVLHVKTAGDIDHKISERKKKFRSMKLDVQPFILVVGPELDELSQVYVCLDNARYEVQTVMEGIDFLLKIFMIFDVQYPLECKHTYYLLQWGILKIHCLNDEELSFVSNALSKIDPLA